MNTEEADSGYIIFKCPRKTPVRGRTQIEMTSAEIS